MEQPKKQALITSDLSTILHALFETFADVVVKEDVGANLLESSKIRAKKMVAEWKQESAYFEKNIEKGALLLFQKIIELAQEQQALFSDEVVRDLAKLRLVSQIISEVAQDYLKEIELGKSIKEIMNLSATCLGVLYQAAMSYYKVARYEDALYCFMVLVLLDSKNSLFWLAIGHARFLLLFFDEALDAYAMAAYYNPADPVCHIFSAKCYRIQADRELAQNALEVARLIVRLCPEFKIWNEVIEKEEELLVNLKKSA